jgi:hypothetical protein
VQELDASIMIIVREHVHIACCSPQL